MEKPLENIRLFITHPGSAHRDDFYSAALLLGLAPHIALQRKKPSAQEIADPTILIFDIGENHCEDHNNYDHHQFEKPNSYQQARCSISLILQKLGKETTARTFWKWLAPTEILDSMGPFALAQYTNANPKTFLDCTHSPLESYLLQSFAQEKEISPKKTPLLHQLLCEFGKNLLQTLNNLEVEYNSLHKYTQIREVKGLIVIQYTPEKIEFSLEALHQWTQNNYPQAAILVYPDIRNLGSTNLYRIEDLPKVNFANLENHPDILFAHKNGFIAKTKANITTPILKLIESAILN